METVEGMEKAKLISFVIPVFRNEGSLKLTYEGILHELKRVNYDYEFLFVNDGSDDGSLDELKELNKQDTKVRIVNLTRNFGQVQAIIAGMANAKGDLIISLSADLQDPVDKIPEMLDAYENQNDVVICNRPIRYDKFSDRFLASVYYALMKTSNLKIPEGGFDLFLLSARAVKSLLKLNENNRHLHADIIWLGYSVKLIPTIRKQRTIGKSQYSFKKKINSVLIMYLNSSYLPIRLMSIIGFITAFSGFIYATLIVYAYYVQNTPFKGWAPIMILILIIGGLIMIMLGIIGEYLWRIYDETKKRPFYLIKEIIGDNE